MQNEDNAEKNISKKNNWFNGIQIRQRRNDILKEIFRKSIHLCSAFIPLFLHYLYWPVMIALAVVLIFYCVSEALRLNGINIPVISTITNVAARKRDENHFVLGPVTLTVGILLTAFIWDEIPYTVGIFALAFGDGLASLSGKLFGRIIIPFTKGKTVAGSLTCFAAIFISCFCVTKSSLIAIIVASSGMIIELLPIKDIDNIMIPVILGGITQAVLK